MTAEKKSLAKKLESRDNDTLVSHFYAPIAQLDRVPGFEPGG